MRTQSTNLQMWAAVACSLVCLAAITAPAWADKGTKSDGTFRVGDRTIRVERFGPTTGKHPVLIVLPGVDGADRDEGKLYREQARLHARRGYIVLLVHYQDGTDVNGEELTAVRQRFRGLFRAGADLRPEDLHDLARHFDGWIGVARAAIDYARVQPRESTATASPWLAYRWAAPWP